MTKPASVGLTPLLRDLVFEVLPHFGLEHVGEDELLSGDRHKNLADARAVCMWLARKKTALSFPEIGRCFGKDHRTIMWAYNKIEHKLAVEPDGFVATIARGVFISFQPERFQAAHDASSGARELNFGAVPVVKIELDLECDVIGAVA